MPSIGWRLRDGSTISYEEAVAKAYEEGAFEKFPAPVLQAMQNTRTDGDWLSPSAAGGCNRQRVLKRTHPFFQDLESTWTAFTGSAYHREIAAAVPGGNGPIQAEVYQEMELRFNLRDGRPHSMKMQGTIDLIDWKKTSDNHVDIYDWKTVGDFQYYDTELKQKINREMPSAKHELQINLYGLMLRWQGLEVDNLFIWYVKSEGKKNVTRRLVRVPIWDMEEAYHLACELAEPLAWYEVTGELPGEVYDPSWVECKFCPLVDRCREIADAGT